jgi:hypothetical protein
MGATGGGKPEPGSGGSSVVSGGGGGSSRNPVGNQLGDRLELSPEVVCLITPWYAVVVVIQQTRLRCEAATPGPWRSFVEGRDHTSGSNFIMTGEGSHRGNDIELSDATIADQDFIAHARQDIPRLLDEIRRLKALAGKVSGKSE